MGIRDQPAAFAKQHSGGELLLLPVCTSTWYSTTNCSTTAVVYQVKTSATAAGGVYLGTSSTIIPYASNLRISLLSQANNEMQEACGNTAAHHVQRLRGRPPSHTALVLLLTDCCCESYFYRTTTPPHVCSHATQHNLQVFCRTLVHPQ